MKLVVGSIVGTVLAVALAVGAWFGAGYLPPRSPPLTQLTIKLDNSGVPAIAARSLFATVRDGLREPRIGFASIGTAGDTIDVTLAEGVDQAQALDRLRELSRQPGPNGAAAEQFTIGEADGA